MKYKLRKEINKTNLSIEELILYNRGIESKEEMDNFIKFSLEDINDYTNLNNIIKGIEILHSCLLKEEPKILIVVDSDVDGYSSSAIMGNYIYDNYGISCIYQIHDNKFHGIEDTILQEKNEYDLIIIPDAGSNQNDLLDNIVETFNVPIIILDHHEVEKENNNEKIILINNQNSNNYTNKNLSGAGIVWQFIRGYSNIYANEIKKDEMCYIDLAMLGNSADMMSVLEPETKVIIQEGIQHILNNKNSFLKTNNLFLNNMLDKASYNMQNTISSLKISFYIVPPINAVTRIGTLDERTVVFYAFLSEYSNKFIPSTKRGHKEGDFESYIEQATRISSNIRNRQNKLKEDNYNKLLETITEEKLNNNILVLESNMDKNLNGLVANQLMYKFHKPVMLLNKIIENDIVYYSGSCRSPGDIGELSNLKKYIEESNYSDYCLGHAAAFGVKFTKQNLDSFIEYSNENALIPKSEASETVDIILNMSDINEEILYSLLNMEIYYGQNFPEILLAIENIQLDSSNCTLLSPDSRPTLKININNNIIGIKFGFSVEEYNSLINDNMLTYINIIAKPNLNIWNGNANPQLIIENYEITKRKYNF